MTLCGKGIRIAIVCFRGRKGSFWLGKWVWLGFSSSTSWELLGLEDDDGRASTCFPLLKVMALILSLGFMMVWDDKMPEFYIFCSFNNVAI